ncbi:MAG: CsgG/HfaB family protein [Bryobacterales bacterium]|nr:curli production assembly protein CsgG [Bryobacteraceae bacterium]MDW8130363.1 CsgG/HfaB family protein [Bryobacterales bacterium]
MAWKAWTGVLLAAMALCAQPKKRVAVLDFDYATVRSSVAAIWGTDRDVGKGIADLLVEKLVQGGVYTVVERKAIDKILAEQNFSNSDRADAATAAKIGRILGVDAIIIGSITQFGRDDKATTIGGEGFGGITRRYGLGGIQRREAKAVVEVSARMISTDTAEILAVGHGAGESARSGTSLLGAGGSSGAGGAGAYDMTSKNFAATLIGEAVHKAVHQLSQALEASAARLPARAVQINGLIADVSGNTVILNVGSRAGVKVGDRLQVRRKIREVRDPATGKVIRAIEDKIGEVVITEVDEVSAVGTFAGASPAKVGDAVRSP